MKGKRLIIQNTLLVREKRLTVVEVSPPSFSPKTIYQVA
jgi:hypothetical protein